MAASEQPTVPDSERTPPADLPTVQPGRKRGPLPAHNRATLGDLTGKAIAGKYLIGRKIAQGGFGVVYEARQKIFDDGRRVAFKSILPDSALATENVKRFQQEALAAGRLQDPHVCKVFDAGVDEGVYYLVMEFAVGGSLGSHAGTQIEIRDAIRWLRQAAQGLLAAEKNTSDRGELDPIFHRDIKPANLLLSKDGDVLVADFGAAKLGGGLRTQLTQENVPLTPNFASPEQLTGEDLDHRSDLYSLGLTFYYLLTGKLGQDRFMQAQDPQPLRKNAPAELCRIIRKMTEPKRDDRHASFADVIAELRELERDVRLPRALIAAFAILLPVLAVLGLEASGVINLIGPEALTADATAETLAEYRTRYANLVAQGERIDGDGDWKAYEELRAPITGVLTDARAVVQRVDGLIADYGADLRVKLPADIRSLSELQRQFEAAEADVKQATAVHTKLASVTDTLGGGFLLATADARASLEKARDRDVLAKCPELDKRWADLDARITTQAQAREGAVEALAARLRAGSFDLDLETEASALVETMKSVRENVLEARARSLVAAVRAARSFDERIPRWPADGASDSEAIATAAFVASQVAALDLGSSDAELKSWWVARQQRLMQGWAGQLADRLGRAGDKLRKQINDLNATIERASEQEHRTVADERARFMEKLKELARADPLSNNRTVLDALLKAQMPDLKSLPTERKPDPAEFAALSKRVDTAITKSIDDPAELKVLVDQIGGLRRRLDVAIAAVAKGERPESSLDVLDREFTEVQQLLERGREARQALATLEAELPGIATADSRARLGSAASYTLRDKCPPIDALCSKLDLEIEGLRAERNRRVAEVRAKFTDATSELDALRREVKAISDRMSALGEEKLIDEARAIEVAIADAESMSSQIPRWPSDGLVAEEALEELPRVALALRKIESAGGNAEAASWWRARQKQVGASWAPTAVRLLVEVQGRLGKRIEDNASALSGVADAEIEAMMKDHRRYQTLLGELRQLNVLVLLDNATFAKAVAIDPVPLPRAPTNSPPEPAFPASWPDDLRKLWRVYAFPQPAPTCKRIAVGDPDSERLYPAEYLRANAGQLIWQVAGRDAGAGGTVWMVLIDGDPPFFVDVHEVTLGEMQAAGGLGGGRDFGDYWQLRRETLRREYTPLRLSFYTSREVAAEFAAQAYPVTKFELLTPSRWATMQKSLSGDWQGTGARSVPPTIGDDLGDVSRSGLRGLRSGLSEWCTEGEPVGPTVYESGGGSGDFRKGAGFRLCLPLSKR